MRRISTWLKTRLETFALLPEYGRAIAKQWMNILFGETVVGAIFLIWWAISNPKNPPLILIFVLAVIVAGYFAWRADHIRLMPKLSVTTLCPPNETDTENPDVTNLFIQIIPECLTDVPVHGCRGRLLQVGKRFEDGEDWRLTGMDSPLFLGWDYYGSGEFTLEPGIRQRLNICWWSNRSRFIIPAVDPLPSKFRNIFNDFESFKFDIRFTAEDCEPVDVAVIVSLRSREWNNPNISLIQGHGSAGQK
jgi:hypothetical protein